MSRQHSPAPSRSFQSPDIHKHDQTSADYFSQTPSHEDSKALSDDGTENETMYVCLLPAQQPI